VITRKRLHFVLEALDRTTTSLSVIQLHSLADNTNAVRKWMHKCNTVPRSM